MKDALALLARYNAVANTRVYDLIAAQPAEMLYRESGSFFHTIIGLLNHILRSDINAITRIRNLLPELTALQSPALEVPASIPPGAVLFDELVPLRERRVAVDELYQALVTAADQAILSKELSFKSFSGAAVHTTVGWNLLHMFNHATHHRGALSQILDAANVENDYSSLASTIR